LVAANGARKRKPGRRRGVPKIRTNGALLASAIFRKLQFSTPMSLKDIRLADRSLAQQRNVVSELNGIVRDIERCERTISELQSELIDINTRFNGPRDTRQDIEYLSGLLACAKRKLAWEKTIASLQKRTPEVLQELTHLLNDPKNPPADEMRALMLRALQGVQDAMERLQSVKPM